LSKWIDSSRTLPKEEANSLLQDVLRIAQNDTIILKAIGRQALVAYKSKELEEYKRHSKYLIKKAEALRDTIYIAKGHSYLGSYYSRKGHIDSAYYYFNEAKTYYLKLKDSAKIASTMLNMAIIETGIGDYYGSENTSVKALSHLEDYPQVRTTRGLYNNLGVLSYETKQNADALYWYQQALDATRDLKGKAVILNNMGLIHRDTKAYEKAIVLFKKALELDIKDVPIKAMVLDNLGYVYMLRGYPEGLDMLQEAFSLRQQSKNQRGLVVSQMHLGHYHAIRRDTAKAKAQWIPALARAKRIKDHKNRLKLLQFLYRELNNVEYSNAYIDLMDSITIVERNYKHQFAKIRYRTKQKEQDYDVLEDRYQVQSQTLESEEQKTKWLTILFVGALCCIGLGFYTYAQRKKIHRQQLLIEQLKARAEEKEALSVQLHDTIASDILLGLQHSEQLKMQFGGNEFDRLVNIFERAYNKARHISQDLNQGYFDKTPFQQKLKNLCVEYSFRNDFGVEIQNADTVNWDGVHHSIKVMIYDITKEALTNILKHAKASRAILRFSNRSKTIGIDILDNGKGMESTDKEGIGLLNIERRISSVSGTLTITDNQPQGTILKLRIPKLTNEN